MEEKEVEKSHFCREIYKDNSEVTNSILLINTIVTNTEVAIGKHSFHKCYVNSVRSMKYVKNLLLYKHLFALFLDD